MSPTLTFFECRFKIIIGGALRAHLGFYKIRCNTPFLLVSKLFKLKNEMISLGEHQLLSKEKHRARFNIDSILRCTIINSTSAFNHLFLLCKVERVCNETRQDIPLTIWEICAIFSLLTRPCGPLENAPRAKFGPRGMVCGPLRSVPSYLASVPALNDSPQVVFAYL